MKISLQLYSARDYNTPWSDVIARVGELGYDAVEGFGPLFDDPAETRDALDKAGLSMPTLHVSLKQLERDPDGVANIAHTLSAKAIYAPWIAPEERPTDAAGWEAFTDRLIAVHKNITTHGFAFGWHNHDFEFVATTDGQIPMDIILTRGSMLEWEADLAWIVRGGSDPLDWIERYGNRISAIHFKDIAPEGENADEDGWSDPGTGTLDWPALYAAIRDKSKATVLVAEHDKPSDFNRFATKAIETFRGF